MRSTAGYSLAEVTTALLIASILLAFVWQAIISVARVVDAWEQRVYRNGVAVAMSRMQQRDIRHVSAITLGTDSTWRFHPDDGLAVRYALQDGTLFRNGIAVFPASLRLTRIVLSVDSQALAFPVGAGTVTRWLAEDEVLWWLMESTRHTGLLRLEAAYRRRPGGRWPPPEM